jgi:hypothetical protein
VEGVKINKVRGRNHQSMVTDSWMAGGLHNQSLQRNVAESSGQLQSSAGLSQASRTNSGSKSDQKKKALPHQDQFKAVATNRGAVRKVHDSPSAMLLDSIADESTPLRSNDSITYIATTGRKPPIPSIKSAETQISPNKRKRQTAASSRISVTTKPSGKGISKAERVEQIDKTVPKGKKPKGRDSHQVLPEPLRKEDGPVTAGGHIETAEVSDQESVDLDEEEPFTKKARPNSGVSKASSQPTQPVKALHKGNAPSPLSLCICSNN